VRLPLPFTCLTFALALAGCSHLEYGRDNAAQTLAYTDAAGKNHQITGSLGYGFASEKTLTISMDGQPAINGHLDKTAAGIVSGNFGAALAVAYCSSQPRSYAMPSGLHHSYAVTCQIHADGTPIGALSF